MTNRNPKIAIIIPLHWALKKQNYNRFINEFKYFLELDYDNYEITLAVDKKVNLPFKSKKIRLLTMMSKNPTSPAEKRDYAFQHTKADYYAYIDDDSYPDRNWLKNAIKVLNKKKNINVVCGPGLTPPSDSFAQKITGAILSSSFGSGPYAFRFRKDRPRFTDDFPAYNMIISASALEKVKGWGTTFYGGEDTVICIKLTNSGERIYYHPSIITYHHRRTFPLQYIKQVGSVGMHRGYFTIKYPQTSLRVSYFAPALLTLGLPLILFLFLTQTEIRSYLSLFGLAAYFVIFADSRKYNSLLIALILPFALLVNHITYGQSFIKGLYTKSLTK